MITLTFGDFIVVFILNLVLATIVSYATNFAKREAELSAEEGSNDKEHVKKLVREAISEARSVLAELRVNEFNVTTGKRRLSRMNTLVEKLSLADEDLGTKVWQLVNAPVFISTINKVYNGVEHEPEVVKYRTAIINAYLEDIQWALKRCGELERKPIVK